MLPIPAALPSPSSPKIPFAPDLESGQLDLELPLCCCLAAGLQASALTSLGAFGKVNFKLTGLPEDYTRGNLEGARSLVQCPTPHPPSQALLSGTSTD